MTTIYSGYYTQKPKPQWVNRATKKQAHWAINNNYNYCLLTDLTHWAQHYPHTDSNNFGSLIKLLALEKFIQSEEQTFIWIDMDVYPTQKAYGYKIDETTDAILHQKKNKIKDQTDWFKKAKYNWAQYEDLRDDYWEINTGFMIFTKPTAQSAWDFINKDHNINTKPWWDAYLQKQIETIREDEEPWYHGNDEAIFEEWFNRNPPNPHPKNINQTLQSLTMKPDAIFHHYYMKNKDNYPDD